MEWRSGTYRSQTYRNAYPASTTKSFTLSLCLRWFVIRVLFKRSRMDRIVLHTDSFTCTVWIDEVVMTLFLENQDARRWVSFSISNTRSVASEDAGSRSIMYGGSDRILMGVDLSVNVVEIRISGLSTNHNTISPGCKRLISTFLSFEIFVVTDLCRDMCVCMIVLLTFSRHTYFRLRISWISSWRRYVVCFVLLIWDLIWETSSETIKKKRWNVQKLNRWDSSSSSSVTLSS